MARIIEGLAELAGLIGQEAGVSEWMEVTQEKIDEFAKVSGDRQWIHVDVERCRRESPFGKTIAHGFLTVSLLSELSRQAVEVRGEFKMRINYGFNRLRFVAPVVCGARIRARFTVKGVKENEVTWLVTVDLEGSEKPALVAEWLARFY